MMYLCDVILTGFLAFGISAGGVADTNSRYMLLRQEVVARLETFKRMTAEAAEHGFDLAREQVTITTAELFLRLADWDIMHPDQLQAAIGSWWRVREQADQISRELPERELREVLMMLDVAEQELQHVLQRRDSRRPAPRVDASRLVLSGSYFQMGDQPVFPSSFVWMPDNPELAEAYGEIGGAYIHPPNLQPDGSVHLRYRSQESDEPMGYVFLGHRGMPKWVLEKHPDIIVGARHFTGYDIDHPVVRDVWRALLAAAVPEFAGKKVSQGGYLLANEPHWFSGTKEWATGSVSDYTMTKFRTWLRSRHGTIDVLNRLWSTHFASFADVFIQIPVDVALRGSPIWYDWCRFNMDRVTEWFAFLKSEIRRHDPGARVHIKLIPDHFAGGSRSHGLDFESLLRLQDIIGCDAKIVRTKSWRDKGDWDERYACDWRGLSIPYDFFKSVSPDKLLFDSEFHGLSTVHWRDPEMPPEYVRCIYWLAHLHGMGMNQTWYWSREVDGSPKTQSMSGFYASNLTLPRVMDAFGRTMKELNAFASEVITLAGQPKPVRIFYSETSAIQDLTAMDRVYETYRALYHSGIPLGFTTGRMLAEATESELRRWPIVVVSHANYVTVNEREALERYVTQGGTLILIGSESLKRDEYGRPYERDLEMVGEGLYRVKDTDDAELLAIVERTLRPMGLTAPVSLKETNPVGLPGCVWRTAPWRDGYLLLIINLGKSEAKIALEGSTACHDLIANVEHPVVFRMLPFDVKLLHVQ